MRSHSIVLLYLAYASQREAPEAHAAFRSRPSGTWPRGQTLVGRLCFSTPASVSTHTGCLYLSAVMIKQFYISVSVKLAPYSVSSFFF